MPDKKINDLTASGSVVDTMQLETDITGSIANKITTIQVKNYTNAGKATGKTIEGGTGAAEHLLLDSTSNGAKGDVQVADGSTLHANTVNYEVLVTDDNDIPNKKYVDDASPASEAWQRDIPTTTISVTNAGDDIDLSTAGLMKSGEFDSTNISYYDLHPTFTGTTDIIDKKYADDLLGLTGQRDVLTVGFDGQTSFTLSSAPTNTDTMLAHVRGQFYDYSYGFTVSGTTLTWLDPGAIPFTLKTTDRFVVIYDYDIAASPFNQLWQKVLNTLKPVTLTDDVEVKDLHIGKTTSGTIDATVDIPVALLSSGTGTVTISPTGTGDLILDSVGGKITIDSTAPIEVTGTFSSTDILTYSAHPTFTVDEQLVDKKYVDDTIIVNKNIQHDVLAVATPGQTVFTLSKTPLFPDDAMFSVNGQLRLYGVSNDFSILGTALTWNDPGSFVLETDDVVQIWYEVTV